MTFETIFGLLIVICFLALVFIIFLSCSGKFIRLQTVYSSSWEDMKIIDGQLRFRLPGEIKVPKRYTGLTKYVDKITGEKIYNTYVITRFPKDSPKRVLLLQVFDFPHTAFSAGSDFVYYDHPVIGNINGNPKFFDTEMPIPQRTKIVASVYIEFTESQWTMICSLLNQGDLIR